MTPPSVRQAARNNAEWCDAVCAAQGIPGEFSPLLWLNRGATPPYYPNIITLAPASIDLLRELEIAIRDVHTTARGELGIKDSFGDLDLAALGCHVLFDAQWIARQPSPAPPPQPDDGVIWSIITDESDLITWREAWDPDVLATNPVFMPSLLTDDNIAFMAGRRDDRIVAGAIANRHAGLIGISNVFSREYATPDVWRGCIASAAARFGSLPLVGYESGADLVAARALGFDPIGPLRVWLTSPT